MSVGDILGQEFRDKEDMKNSLLEGGDVPFDWISIIDVAKIKHWNIVIIRSDTGEWMRRRWEWKTSADFDKWTGDEGFSTENDELKVIY